MLKSSGDQMEGSNIPVCSLSSNCLQIIIPPILKTVLKTVIGMDIMADTIKSLLKIEKEESYLLCQCPKIY